MLRRLPLLVLLAAGCSSADDAGRVALSGAIRFGGQPIVAGEVLLTPDDAQGNSGPQGIAVIRDGRYDTAAGGGRGFAGGPTIIRVTGFKALNGELLCVYEFRADLPREGGTFDIDIPRTAEAKRTHPEP